VVIVRHLFLFKILIFFFTFSLISSCYQPRKNWPNYAQESYLEQRSKMKSEPKPLSIDQNSDESFFIVKEGKEYDPMWIRKNYETIEQWIDRINFLIEMNQEIIKLGHDELLILKNKNQELVGSIQELNKQSEGMKLDLVKNEVTNNFFNDQRIKKKVPFIIHFVEEGDTLYGISMQFYGKGNKIKNIMQWNQGWIRRESSVLAGLGLILFPEEAKEKNSDAVSVFMKKIKWKEEQLNQNH
jgi:hypothetical protein